MPQHRELEDFSAPIDWPRSGWREYFKLSEAQAAEVAETMDLSKPPKDMQGLIDVDFEANGKELVFKIQLTGKVTQTCVVSLKPIITKLDESFIRRFRKGDFSTEIELELTRTDGDIATLNEELEPWGETPEERPSLMDFVVEQLGLVLEPFPRLSGAEPDPTILKDPLDAPEQMSPFAALAGLKK